MEKNIIYLIGDNLRTNQIVSALDGEFSYKVKFLSKTYLYTNEVIELLSPVIKKCCPLTVYCDVGICDLFHTTRHVCGQCSRIYKLTIFDNPDKKSVHRLASELCGKLLDLHYKLLDRLPKGSNILFLPVLPVNFVMIHVNCSCDHSVDFGHFIHLPYSPIELEADSLYLHKVLDCLNALLIEEGLCSTSFHNLYLMQFHSLCKRFENNRNSSVFSVNGIMLKNDLGILMAEHLYEELAKNIQDCYDKNCCNDKSYAIYDDHIIKKDNTKRKMEANSQPDTKKNKNQDSSSVIMKKCTPSASDNFINSLWLDHKKQWDTYFQDPSSHPDYKNEKNIFFTNKIRTILSLGGEVDEYNYHEAWNATWKEILQKKFNKAWEDKKCKALRKGKPSFNVVLCKKKKNNYISPSTSRKAASFKPKILSAVSTSIIDKHLRKSKDEANNLRQTPLKSPDKGNDKIHKKSLSSNEQIINGAEKKHLRSSNRSKDKLHNNSESPNKNCMSKTVKEPLKSSDNKDKFYNNSESPNDNSTSKTKKESFITAESINNSTYFPILNEKIVSNIKVENNSHTTMTEHPIALLSEQMVDNCIVKSCNTNMFEEVITIPKSENDQNFYLKSNTEMNLPDFKNITDEHIVNCFQHLSQIGNFIGNLTIIVTGFYKKLTGCYENSEPIKKYIDNDVLILLKTIQTQLLYILKNNSCALDDIVKIWNAYFWVRYILTAGSSQTSIKHSIDVQKIAEGNITSSSLELVSYLIELSESISISLSDDNLTTLVKSVREWQLCLKSGSETRNQQKEIAHTKQFVKTDSPVNETHSFESENEFLQHAFKQYQDIQLMKNEVDLPYVNKTFDITDPSL